VANHTVWISILSDAGITLAEIGRLPSDTDSKLIASTLMALKDILSTEATAASTNFMEGEIESGAFGLMVLRFNDGFSLTLQYFVSNKDGPIDLQVKQQIQEVSLNLGQQMMQVADLPKLAEIGAHIPFNLLTKAYLNACEIARMRIILPNNKKPMIQLFEGKLMEIINKRSDLVDLIDELFGTKGWKIATYNWNSGFLVRERREEVVESLALYILGLIANEDPLMVLMVDQKQNIIKEFVRLLKNILKNRISSPHAPVVKALPSAMDAQVMDSYYKIYLRYLHNSEDILFGQFARKAILAAMKDDASIIFVDIPKKSIRSKFKNLLPKIEVKDAGYFYIEAISPYITDRSKKYVEAFYNGFFETMEGITLSHAAWEILTSFAYEFVTSEQLSQGFQKVKDPSHGERWKKELLKWSNVRKLTQLKVENINEAVTIANASSNAIIQTLAQIIHEQFLYSIDGNLGILVDYYINLYNTLGPSIKASSVMMDIFQLLNKSPFGIDFLVPNSQDFIFSGFDRGKINIEIPEKNLTFHTKNGFVLDGEIYPTYEFLLNNDEFLIKVDDEVVQNGGKEITANLFIELIKDEENYMKAIELAIERRLQTHIFDEYRSWVETISSGLNDLIHYLKDKNRSSPHDLRNLNLKQYSKSLINIPSYEAYVNSQLEEIPNMMASSVESLDSLWDEFIVKSANNKKEFENDYIKSTEKTAKNIIKEINKIDKDIEKIIKAVKSDALKDIKSLKKEIKKSYQKTEDQILNYDTSGSALFPPTSEIQENIHKYIETSTVLNVTARDQLAVALALEIFENPTDAVLDPAYNEVIQNDLSKPVKDVLSAAKDKKDFERLLIEKSYEIVDKMYESLRKIFNMAENIFLGRNAPISVEDSKIFLKLGKLSVDRFRNKAILEEGIKFPGIKIAREASSWSVTYEFPETPQLKSEEPTLVTLGDAVRYLTTIRIREDIKKIISGLETISDLIEPDAGTRLHDLINKLYVVIYSKLSF
jgi:ElaB/YqjD/DUF883 family membrane-anchored ribosome-binding protein